MTAPDVDAYFARLGYDGPATPQLRTLQRLHVLHADRIPFENISPFVGEPVRLDLESLQDKMLRRGRGGWCFEQNLLLARMLEAIGFDVTPLAARVRMNVAPEQTTPRSHMLLRVRLGEGDYIADVGFGGLTLSSPLKLEAGVEQATLLEPNRLVEVDDGYRLEARIGNEWRSLYAFDLARQQVADYEVSNWYLCNHPESIFLKMAVAARCEPSRRLTLRGVRYSEHYPDGRGERLDIRSVAEWREVVEARFGIRVPDAPSLEEKLEKMIAENAGA